jgi:Flp pilus assembly protein TadB
MIYLLGGGKNPLVRVVVGAVMVAAGIVIHGGAILIALGAVLVAWGGALALKKHRADRQDKADGDGRTA